ncbi:hypothetical protein AB0D49_32390 [Streptomyces sp. NPDC048290]|uniref:hypothetical protein n=1 Tax=Streptomyces sp. NPDC048290 TaxID=3155811 RepID=UPI00341E5538
MTTVRAASVLPRLDRLSPRQQMAMDCARCSRRLGMDGRVWGEVRHRGRPFLLWVCAPQCAPHRAAPFAPGAP